MPDITLTKLGDNDSLKASAVAIDQVGHFLVTASRNEANNLAITSWFLGPDGTPLVYDQMQAGPVGLVDVRHVGNGVFATAVGNSAGNLEIITWSLSPRGKITRHEEIVFGKISALATDAFEYHHRLVVAMVDSHGKLRIKLIDIDKETQALEQVDNEVADDASQVDIEATAHGLINLYTADGDGNFQVTSFLHGRDDVRPSRGEPLKGGQLGPNLKVAKRGGRRRKAHGSRIALIDRHSGLRITSTTFARSRTERGAIEITRGDSTKAASGDAISIASNDRDAAFWTAVQTDDKKLRVDLWGYGDPVGHAPEGPAALLASQTEDLSVSSVSCVSPYHDNHLVTAAISSDNRLVVSAWQATGVNEAD